MPTQIVTQSPDVVVEVTELKVLVEVHTSSGQEAVEAGPEPVVIEVGVPGLAGPKGDAGDDGEQGEDGQPGSFIGSWRGDWSDKFAVYNEGDLLFFEGEGVYLVLSTFVPELGSVPTDYDVDLVVPQGIDGSIAENFDGEWDPNGTLYDGGTIYRYVDPVEPSNSGLWMAQFDYVSDPGAPPPSGNSVLLVPDGAPGQDGSDGTDGESAYAIAVANGFLGTEVEWLASLQGAPGDDGADGSDATVTEANINAALGGPIRQYPPRVTPAVDTYMHPFAGPQIATRISLAAQNDRLYYLPGYVTVPTDVSNPRVNVNVGQAGTNCRVGLCEWNVTTGTPGALIVDWGTTATTTSGFKTFSNGAAVASLVPGQAYAVMFVSGGGTAPSYYYVPFVPLGIPALAESASTISSIVSWYTGTGASQRTGGFTDPPDASPAAIELLVNQFGMRAFVYFGTVEPTPP